MLYQSTCLLQQTWETWYNTVCIWGSACFQVMLGFIASARMSGYSLSITILKNQGRIHTFLETYTKKSEEAFHLGCEREDSHPSSQHSAVLTIQYLVAAVPAPGTLMCWICAQNGRLTPPYEWCGRQRVAQSLVKQPETRGFGAWCALAELWAPARELSSSCWATKHGLLCASSLWLALCTPRMFLSSVKTCWAN